MVSLKRFSFVGYSGLPTLLTDPVFHREDAKNAKSLTLRSAAVPRIDGGTVGDLAIAAHRCEARQLRTQASVVAILPPGRRARGASVPPYLDEGIFRSTTGQDERRGLRSSRAQTGGQGNGDECSHSETLSCPPGPGRRPTAGTSPVLKLGWGFFAPPIVSAFICVICGFSCDGCVAFAFFASLR